MADDKKKIFPNLNSLRFFAAMLVTYHHAEITKADFKLPSLWDSAPYRRMGELSVTFFFVLSGFLITFLLLKEKQNHNAINIKKFYMRRALRIWPLYYLIVFSGFLFFPFINFFQYPVFTDLIHDDWLKKFSYFLLFLPQIPFFAFPPNPYCVQAWSIGVEEQFYLLWPIIINKVKNIKPIIFSVILFFIFFPKIIVLMFQNHEKDTLVWYLLRYLEANRLSCIAIGCFIGLGYFKNYKSLLKIVYNKIFFTISLFVLIILMIKGFKFKIADYEIFSILFAIVILNLATKPRGNKKILEYPILNYFGKISYGIYMFNNLAAIISVKIILYFLNNQKFSIFYNLTYNLLNFFITICMASISYRFYESYFLKKKELNY